jgi:SAM-dependent methyltransferase
MTDRDPHTNPDEASRSDAVGSRRVGERIEGTAPSHRTLREEWHANASHWTRWARAPGHDAYWRFHARRFLELVPAPGRLTVDVGCGEGRLSRDLATLGHRVVSLDASPAMALAHATHEAPTAVAVSDASRLSLADRCADLAVAFMVLQDVDDLDAVTNEVSRVLTPGGKLCIAIVHPINSAGRFEANLDAPDEPGELDSPDVPFVVRGSYLEPFRYAEAVERDGLSMTFHSEHRTLECYSRSLESAGFVIEAVREVTDEEPRQRWRRIPLFLHLRTFLKDQPDQRASR